MRKVLTPDLISAKTRCDNLLLIKNLNLWGNEIEDIRLLRQMPNIEILSLSVNRISSLKEFANCKKLQELYLRKNNISDLEELRYLIDLPDLRILWLLDNPCSEQENYREIVISTLPNIRKLDNNDVTVEERKHAEGSIRIQPGEGNKMTGGDLKPRASLYEESRGAWNEEKIVKNAVVNEKKTLESEKNERNIIRNERNTQNDRNASNILQSQQHQRGRPIVILLKNSLDF